MVVPYSFLNGIEAEDPPPPPTFGRDAVGEAILLHDAQHGLVRVPGVVGHQQVSVVGQQLDEGRAGPRPQRPRQARLVERRLQVLDVPAHLEQPVGTQQHHQQHKQQQQQVTGAVDSPIWNSLWVHNNNNNNNTNNNNRPPERRSLAHPTRSAGASGEGLIQRYSIGKVSEPDLCETGLIPEQSDPGLVPEAGPRINAVFYCKKPQHGHGVLPNHLYSQEAEGVDGEGPVGEGHLVVVAVLQALQLQQGQVGLRGEHSTRSRRQPPRREESLVVPWIHCSKGGITWCQ